MKNKVFKKLAAAGVASMMAVTGMVMSASAYNHHGVDSNKYDWTFTYTVVTNSAIYGSTPYHSAYTHTKNCTGYTIVVGARVSFQTTNGSNIDTAASTASKGNDQTHYEHLSRYVTQSAPGKVYHCSEWYNGNTTMSGLQWGKQETYDPIW